MVTDCMICREGLDLLCVAVPGSGRTKPMGGRNRETDQLGVPTQPCEGGLPRLLLHIPCPPGLPFGSSLVSLKNLRIKTKYCSLWPYKVLKCSYGPRKAH